MAVLKPSPHGEGFFLGGKVGAMACLNDKQQLIQLIECGDKEASYRLVRKLVREGPNDPGASFLYGFLLEVDGKLSKAENEYRRSLRLDPSDYRATYNLGNVLRKLGRFREALDLWQQTIQQRPQFPEAYNNSGKVHLLLGEKSLARQHFMNAVSVSRFHYDSNYSLARLLRDEGKFHEALSCCQNALIGRKTKEIYNELAAVVRDAKGELDHLLPMAYLCVDQALSLDPAYVPALRNKALLLLDHSTLQEAAQCMQQLYAISPKEADNLGDLIHLKMKMCVWDDSLKLIDDARELLSSGHPVCSPFTALHIFDDPQIIRSSAELYSDVVADLSTSSELVAFGSVRPSREKLSRLRIGYFSPDFRLHAVSHLFARVMELHSRENFEIYAFSFSSYHQDSMSSRIQRASEHWVDISKLSDIQAIKLVRSHNLDVAVDLCGYTKHCRPALFEYRLAAIQIGFLGYPGTLGSRGHDFIFADSVVIPSDDEQFYSEQVIRLPYVYQPNDPERLVPIFKRSSFQLDEGCVVFSAFHNFQKIHPAVFEVWLKLLLAVPNSVLWLLDDNEVGKSNLRERAISANIPLERIRFAERVSHDVHLGRLALTDLFLDTFPYGGHTSTSDALWAGVPVLTRIGRAFQGRVAASLLKALHLSELVTHSESQYLALATRLGQNPQELAELKARLAQLKATSPVFDASRFTRDLESAMLEAVSRHE